MPLYEFACETCEHTFEELVRDSEERVQCPECHGERVERLLSVPSAKVVNQALPMSCNPQTPPCGPGCCKL
jgi:putative FmdB family regulatory protein